MILLYVIFLATLFQCGFCECQFYPYDAIEEDGSTVSSSICHMGECVNNNCICFDGWAGDTCDRCNGRVVLTESSGFVFDGPRNYSNFNKCFWLIQPSVPHTSLRLVFHDFATECGWDHLYIYDGDSAFSPLLGSFNGLLYSKDLTNRRRPEFIAKSGKAFLHFYSDAALSLAGFNISYTVDECQYNCNGHGNCANGSCSCQSQRSGETCSLCTNSNCSESSNELTECLRENFTSCEHASMKGLWSISEFSSSTTTARASSAVALFDDDIWMYGGLEFSLPRLNPGQLSVFNVSTNSWLSFQPTSSQNVTPEARYEHSMVTWEDSLIVFGGKLVRNEKIVNEMWKYDFLLGEWNIVKYSANFSGTVTNSASAMSRLLLAGHTADLVKFSNGSEIMVVLFGYHPTMLLTKFVYEYNPVTKLWTMPRPSGFLIPVLLGHSSAYDTISNFIYIHGGYSLSTRGLFLTSFTFSYDPLKRHFSMLRSSKRPIYLHSASFIDGMMYIYGGNEGLQRECYSSTMLAYNAACDRWVTLDSPPESFYPRRYGHQSAVVSTNVGKKLYVFSGYDSSMISNILIYELPKCSSFNENETICDGAFNAGISCFWNGLECSSVSSLNGSTSMDICSNVESDIGMCSTSILNVSCNNCLSNPYSCSYCSSTCKQLSNETCHNTICGIESNSYCHTLVNCEQCSLASDECEWILNHCHARISTLLSRCGIYNINSCSDANSCSDCTALDSCMWCVRTRKCFPSFTYMIQFPYGQCMEWTTTTCPADECSEHKICSECHNFTHCGWCDDGSSTGLGHCVEGSSSGPVTYTSNQYVIDNEVCRFESWYFSTCPNCQCNGHSRCDENGNCIDCQDNTEGRHCNLCKSGFFGNPLNGGQCSPCQCNGKATTCGLRGDCNCFTKGVRGFSCDKCDVQNKYFGDPTGNGTCYYPIQANFVFTFNLAPPLDAHVTAINFQNTPSLDEDVRMTFSADRLCNVKLTVISSITQEIFNGELTVTEYVNTASFEFTFSNSDLNFGDPQMNSTIRIYVSNFTTPNRIKVSLIQRNNTLLTILLILFSSFLAILVVAAGVWKVKMMYDAHRHRANRAIKMKEMAARPFAVTNLCCDDTDRSIQLLQAPSTQGSGTIAEEMIPDAFCEEKCVNDKSSVVSVFLWLPSNVPHTKQDNQDSNPTTNEDSFNLYVSPPPGQPALAIGTVLVNRQSIASSASVSRSRRKVSHRNSRIDDVVPLPASGVENVVRSYDNAALQHVRV